MYINICFVDRIATRVPDVVSVLAEQGAQVEVVVRDIQVLVVHAVGNTRIEIPGVSLCWSPPDCVSALVTTGTNHVISYACM